MRGGPALLLSSRVVGMVVGGSVICDLGRTWPRLARRSRPRVAGTNPRAPAATRSARSCTLLAHAGHHRAAGRGDQQFAAPARRRLQGARVHQRPAQGVLVQGRGHRALQPALLLDPARGRGVALPPLQPPGVGGAARPRRLQGGQRRARATPAGDETLREMAEILIKHSRGINVICRYGGDEFAVLLVETSQGGRAPVRRPHPPGARHVPVRPRPPVTASFGIAALPEDVAPAAEDLIRAADEALYAAKRAGKNRVSVYEDVAAAPGRAPRSSRRERPPGPPRADRRRRPADPRRPARVLPLRGLHVPARAPTASEGLELFDAERPPLTVTDVKMPVMDGIELLKQRPRHRPRRRRARAHRRGRRADRGREPQVRRLRLHPEAGEHGRAAHRGRARARAPPAPHRAPRVPRAAGAAGGGGHPRSRRRAARAARGPTGPRWRRSAPPSTPATSAPRRTPAACAATRWPPRAPTACPSRSSATSSTACSCTTSARSASPTRSCSSPGRSPPRSGRSCARIPRSAGSSSSRSRSCAARCRSSTTTTSAGTAPATRAGLAGETIPLGARIFAVADAFDAMTFDRPYSKAIPSRTRAPRSAVLGHPLRSRGGGDVPRPAPRDCSRTSAGARWSSGGRGSGRRLIALRRSLQLVLLDRVGLLLELLDLAGAGQRELVDDLHVARHLEVGDVPRARNG